MRALWMSLALVVAAGVVAIAVAGGGGREDAPARPSAAERKAADDARAAKLRRERARIAARERRDPVVRRERARLRAEQRPRSDRARPGSGSRAAQAALVAALERSITRDANRRFRAGKLDKRTVDTLCTPLVRPHRPDPPPPALTATGAGYECTAATFRFRTEVSRTGTAILGFPFWARVNFRTGRYSWCKINLLPSEHGIGASAAFVPLAPVCDLLKRGGPA